MDRLPTVEDERVLVGTETADDAGVVRLSDEIALVQTVDVFPPVVNDPYAYGRIVAANSLSDCYAMGATPLTVMNIIMFPSGVLDVSVVAPILLGALENIRASGAALVGGHTQIQAEINYGLSVTGLVHPERIVRNSTARPGDLLFLTKPIGTGILTTAGKAGLAPEGPLREATGFMAILNKEASEAMVEVGVSAATDVTGFGLMGHAFEIARGSRVTLEIEAASVPVFDGVFDGFAMGLTPGGSLKNQNYLLPFCRVAPSISEALCAALFDCQTSGGLLIAVPEERADALVAAFERRGVFHARIGRVLPLGDSVLVLA